MNKITERYREWGHIFADIYRDNEDSNHNDIGLRIAVKLAELDKLQNDPGQPPWPTPPQERVVDSEDMVCPQCQKPLTNPDDPCDCPPRDLEDAVTNILLEHGVASKPLTQDIVAAVQPLFDELEEKAKAFVRRTGKAEHHLETAVKLLGVANGLTFSQSTYEGHKCAKELHGEVDKLLALPAIKAILKQIAADATAMTEDKE